MLTINPKEVPIPTFHAYLVGGVAPRPIAFVSSIDKEGRVNLSPFSYFNVFGSNPPTLVFSPSTRVRDNSKKHTLENVLEHDEVVINMVNYNMVAQMSLASTEYAKGVNEFVKAGFTEKPSVLVRPPRVAESPISFECKVLEVVPVGDSGGAANLVVCEVVLAHFQDEILDERRQIDPFKLDAVARMGADWYCRVHGEAIFNLERPNRNIGMGFDGLPEKVKKSKVLTGNDLGLLANFEKLPADMEVQAFRQHPDVELIFKQHKEEPEMKTIKLHQLAKNFIVKGDVKTAWLIVMLQ